MIFDKADDFPVCGGETLTLPAAVSEILARFDNAGYEIFCVGGCVRDFLRGVEPNDWDLCTNALPEEILRVCPDMTCIPTGIRHGTVTVISRGSPLEITTFRKDGTYADHRRPDSVTFCTSLREDCARRDFTVNAMAYHPQKGIMDFFGGREDLKNGIIRCVGDPHTRFSEDALRILRALRFSAVLGFSAEPETAEALQADRALLSCVARERIAAEFRRLLCGKTADAVLSDHREVFSVILPPEDVPDLFTFDACRLSGAFRHVKGEGERMAVFLHLCGCSAPWTLLRTMTYETSFCREVSALMEESEKPFPDSRIAARRRLSTCKAPYLLSAFSVRRALSLQTDEETAQAYALCDTVLSSRDAIKVSDLAVDGNALLSVGVRGRAVGDMLKRLLDAVMEDMLPNDRESLLEAAKQWMQSM